MKTTSSNSSSFRSDLQKWTLLALAIVAIVSALGSAVVIGRIIEQWATGQVESAAELAASRGGFLFLAGNKTEAMFVLNGFEAIPGVNYAGFVGTDGMVLAERTFGPPVTTPHTRVDTLPQPGEETLSRTVNGEDQWEIWARVDTRGDSDSVIEHPVDGQAIGWLHLVWDGRLVKKVTGALLIVTMGIALLVAGMMGWLMRGVMRRITQPVTDELESQLATINAHATELEGEVKARTQALEDAMEHTETLMMTLTHDMRTPIHSVVGYLKFARDEVDKLQNPKEAQACLDSAERACTQLMVEVQKVIDFARLEAGAVSVSMGYINLDNFAQRIETMFAPLVKEKNNKLTVALASPGIGFVSDEDKLEHIVRNLLSNACKFTADGSIEVTLNAGDGKFTCSVVDTGIGIPKQEAEAMFTQFWHENSAREGFEKGVGLGLFISSRYTELLGGTLGVDTNKGTGSVFTFSAPVEIRHNNASPEARDAFTS